MAIAPTFLAALRRQQRCEHTLLMVQLEQLVPCWWESLHDLAEQVGSERATLNKALLVLDRKSLIARASLPNVGGTWIWWVKRHPTDKPIPSLEPCWTVWDTKNRISERIPIAKRRQWAEQRNIPYQTMRGFLAGRQLKLAGRWTLQSTPLDIPCQYRTINRSAPLRKRG